MTLLEYLEREALALAHRVKRDNGVQPGSYRRCLVLLQLEKALEGYCDRRTFLNLALSQVHYVYTAYGAPGGHLIILDYITMGDWL